MPTLSVEKQQRLDVKRLFFFFLISFSAFPLKAENELISGGGANGFILVGNSFLSQAHLEILKRKSDLLMSPGSSVAWVTF